MGGMSASIERLAPEVAEPRPWHFAVPETELQALMNDHVNRALALVPRIQYLRDDGKWVFQGLMAELVHGIRYKLFLQARNDGTNTAFRNVFFVVHNVNHDRVQFFTDDTYGTEVPDTGDGILRSQVYAETLNSGPLVLRGITKPPFEVRFKITQGVDMLGILAGVDVFAEIIPQGHKSQNLQGNFD